MLGYSGNSGPHIVSIAASRSTASTPDQIVMFIYLTTDPSSGLDDVTAELAAAGVSGAIFSNVYTTQLPNSNGQSTYLQWLFTVTTPLATFKDTVSQLIAAEKSFAKQNPAQTLSFSLGNAQTSAQSQPPCSEPALIADANAQAQKLAAAAAVSSGAIVAMSDGGAANSSNAAFANPTAGGRLGTVVLNTPPVNNCTLSVQFQMY